MASKQPEKHRASSGDADNAASDGARASDAAAGSDGSVALASVSCGITRREAIDAGVGIVALFAVGGVDKALVGEDMVLRPPGAQDESAFIGACIKCDRCRSACPRDVIGVCQLEDGLVNARSPKMDFKRGWCNFCEGRDGYRCVESCPTSAIVVGFDKAHDKIGIAAVDTNECLIYRLSSHTCAKPCLDACEFDALDFDAAANELVVDQDKCNGCGACEHACVSATYGSYTGSDRRGVNIEPVRRIS